MIYTEQQDLTTKLALLIPFQNAESVAKELQKDRSRKSKVTAIVDKHMSLVKSIIADAESKSSEDRFCFFPILNEEKMKARAALRKLGVKTHVKA